MFIPFQIFLVCWSTVQKGKNTLCVFLSFCVLMIFFVCSSTPPFFNYMWIVQNSTNFENHLSLLLLLIPALLLYVFHVRVVYEIEVERLVHERLAHFEHDHDKRELHNRQAREQQELGVHVDNVERLEHFVAYQLDILSPNRLQIQPGRWQEKQSLQSRNRFV